VADPAIAAAVPNATPPRWRPTWLGWLLIAEGVALLATVLWTVQARPLASVLGLALLAVMATNAWCSRRWIATLAGHHQSPMRVIAGDDTLLTAVISSELPTPPVIISGTAPDGTVQTLGQLAEINGQGVRLAWSVRFPRRGWNVVAPLRAANEQPFGVGTAQRLIGPSLEILVLPAQGLIRRELRTRLDTWMEQVATGTDPGEDEPARLRPYRSGDPPRSVNWRASARARELLVTERHTPAARHLALVIDTDATGVTTRRLDRLVSVAATLIDHLIRRGWEISLHGHFSPTGIIGDRDRLIATLAVLEPQITEGDLGDCLPRHRTCLVLAARAIELPQRHPRPLLLTLDECEKLVRLPKRLGF